METIHPVAAHFAVVLPLVALLLEAGALITRQAVLKRSATAALLVAAGMVVLAYISGSNDAGKVVKDILSAYSPDGMHELKEHAGLGYNLMIAIIVTTLLKVVNCKVSNRYLNYTVMALMVAVTLGMFAQGKHGGELVYKYGTIFEAHAIKDTLKTALEDNKETEDAQERAEGYESAIKEALGLEE